MYTLYLPIKEKKSENEPIEIPPIPVVEPIHIPTEIISNLISTLPIKEILNKKIYPEIKISKSSRGSSYEPNRQSSIKTNKKNATLNNMRILVVDDAPSYRKVMIRMLKSRNFHNIDEAYDGVDAVMKVQQALDNNQPYNVIIMDFQMPNMNGPEATKAIRNKMSSKYAVLIIGITGNVLPTDVAIFHDSGVDCVMFKPTPILDVCYVIEGKCF